MIMSGPWKFAFCFPLDSGLGFRVNSPRTLVGSFIIGGVGRFTAGGEGIKGM